jgi:hypothetical protein
MNAFTGTDKFLIRSNLFHSFISVFVVERIRNFLHVLDFPASFASYINLLALSNVTEGRAPEEARSYLYDGPASITDIISLDK